jgi:hypothetical protein
MSATPTTSSSTTAVPAVVASIGLPLSPAAGLVLSTLWLGKALSADLAISTGMVLGGAIIAARPSGCPQEYFLKDGAGNFRSAIHRTGLFRR